MQSVTEVVIDFVLDLESVLNLDRSWRMLICIVFPLIKDQSGWTDH